MQMVVEMVVEMVVVVVMVMVMANKVKNEIGKEEAMVVNEKVANSNRWSHPGFSNAVSVKHTGFI